MSSSDPSNPPDIIQSGATISAVALALASIYERTGPMHGDKPIFASFLILGAFFCLMSSVIALQARYTTWLSGPLEFQVLRAGLVILGLAYAAVLIHALI